MLSPSTVVYRFDGAYDFLSNYYPVEGDRTVEHYYQACKTMVPEERQEILSARLPRTAKQLGQVARLRKDWYEIRVDIMRSLVGFKFLSNTKLGDRLAETGNAVLYAGNIWGDHYWGIDLKSYEMAGVIQGENRLGRILMEVRGQLPERSRHLMLHMSKFEQLTRPEVLDV